MARKSTSRLTAVEKAALTSSPFKEIYPPVEKLVTLVVENFPALGRLTALRFLEWTRQNPEGVVSLPTGKTPEHFIKWVRHLLENWHHKSTREDLSAAGIDPQEKPDLRGLHFVQIDEFYPINPWQSNSFYHYVRNYYIDGIGLDKEKALLIDCSKIGLRRGESLQNIWPDNEVDTTLRYRRAKSRQEAKQKAALERIDQWCHDYEERIRKLGGIGFFLGGIGPDGHIGFNVRGSDHFSTTRLTETNYETQASAATDLGGIEISRNRLVITIGLGTICYNPESTAIIIAAGEAKAKLVADAIQQEPHIHYPATVLQKLKNARFYITTGAARQLQQRNLAILNSSGTFSDQQVERILVDLSVKRRRPLLSLKREDFELDEAAGILLRKRPESAESLAAAVHDRLIAKVESGIRTLTKTRFLHTEPHHDDIMLGYLPYVIRHIRDRHNVHHFACLTGGFTSVSNRFMHQQLQKLLRFLESNGFSDLMAQNYFAPGNRIGRNRDVWQYLDGVAGDSRSMKEEGEARRLLRHLIEIYNDEDFNNLKNRIAELVHYFQTEYPGKKDLPHIQRLKGMCREWEAECLWGYLGWNCDNVHHLRLGFYTGDIFTEEPTLERDVTPVFQLLKQTQPDVVSVAFDPEASGPDTHYKVLQTIAEALRQYEEFSGRSDIRVWGYRNVWYRFHPAEANIFVPVSLNMFSAMHSAFMNAFMSQKDASFPSYEHDGPFSELAQRIQVAQYQTIKTCIGREWFYESERPLIRATRGLVFLREMSLEEFYETSRELKKALENRRA